MLQQTQTLEASQVQQKLNAEKGHSFGQLAGEGAGFLLGNQVGGLVGGVASRIENAASTTFSVVGDGLDKAGLGALAVRPLACLGPTRAPACLCACRLLASSAIWLPSSVPVVRVLPHSV
jgi:hypothetical protein